MCHGFLALRESGERLSHAVGCAFAVCLERKQKRDKECGVTMTFDTKNSTFTRTGSFRQQGLTERLERAVDVPSKPPPVNPFAIERPHATPSLLQRQGSCRGFSTLGQNSPFKRQMSLRVNDLPSNAERLTAFHSASTTPTNNKAVSPIPEVSPGDSVTALCQQLSQGLSQLTNSNSDDFNFNNQSSINQNNITISLTTMNNTFGQSMATPPGTPTINTTLPVSVNFSTPQKSPAISVGSSNASLPKPEQWLGQIVNSASPSPGKMDGVSPRRAASFSAHMRAMSLDSAPAPPNDPFDAEWAAITARQKNSSTNPFLSSNGTPQAFQVQL